MQSASDTCIEHKSDGSDNVSDTITHHCKPELARIGPELPNATLEWADARSAIPPYVPHKPPHAYDSWELPLPLAECGLEFADVLRSAYNIRRL